MLEIWKILTPILIADIVNPVLFAFMVYAAGTKKPLINSLAILIGHTFAYFCAGIALSLGLESLIHRLENPHHADYYIALLVGLLLLWVGVLACRKPEPAAQKKSGNLTPIKALGLGAVVNFVGIPFALPYFAALDQILKLNATVVETLMLLLSYNLLYALPFTIVPILVVIFGQRSQSILQSINVFLERVSAVLMPVLLFLLGGALLADAVMYFVTGKGLF
ncbi:MAG: hypothetical protein DRQ62_03715 [Gammaproteobacteria bacterium]|nr:MAG: hypothetical protein DRQ62_03715 [Gammaproteobacteria bacterium]